MLQGNRQTSNFLTEHCERVTPNSILSNVTIHLLITLVFWWEHMKIYFHSNRLLLEIISSHPKYQPFKMRHNTSKSLCRLVSQPIGRSVGLAQVRNFKMFEIAGKLIAFIIPVTCHFIHNHIKLQLGRIKLGIGLIELGIGLT